MKLEPHNLVSEAYMKELFGFTDTSTFRAFAKREHIRRSKATQKVYIYDLTSAVEVFKRHEVKD